MPRIIASVYHPDTYLLGLGYFDYPPTGLHVGDLVTLEYLLETSTESPTGWDAIFKSLDIYGDAEGDGPYIYEYTFEDLAGFDNLYIFKVVSRLYSRGKLSVQLDIVNRSTTELLTSEESKNMLFAMILWNKSKRKA